MFRKKGLGVCTYRDMFCYADSKVKIQERIQIFIKQDDNESRQFFSLKDDTRDWSICRAKEEIIEY